jgi:hypothetical protein
MRDERQVVGELVGMGPGGCDFRGPASSCARTRLSQPTADLNLKDADDGA